MPAHINADGDFQSDKYPLCPPGKVPLSVKDPTAQDLLWEYAQRRRKVDTEFSEDLETVLRANGFIPSEERPCVLHQYEYGGGACMRCGAAQSQISDIWCVTTSTWVRVHDIEGGCFISREDAQRYIDTHLRPLNTDLVYEVRSR